MSKLAHSHESTMEELDHQRALENGDEDLLDMAQKTSVRRDGHSKLIWDKAEGSFKTVDPRSSRHTHRFEEVLSREDGLTRRCQCGARLWEPTASMVPSQDGGSQ